MTDVYEKVDRWLKDHLDKGGSFYSLGNDATGISARDLLIKHGLTMEAKPGSPNSWIYVSDKGKKVLDMGGLSIFLVSSHNTVDEEKNLILTKLRNDVEIGKKTLRDYRITRCATWISLAISFILAVLKVIEWLQK